MKVVKVRIYKNKSAPPSVARRHSESTVLWKQNLKRGQKNNLQVFLIMNKVSYCCFLLGAELSAKYLLRKCTTEIYQWTLFKRALRQR